MNNKSILDATCGSRMMWFNKNHPDALYVDQRTLDNKDWGIQVKPDVLASFTNLPFDDDSFTLVVFDPPHKKNLSKKSIIGMKYGSLGEDWKDVIVNGFNECWRVLCPNGTLIFKWNETSITTGQIIKMLPQKPLFGHTTSKHGKTKWMVFHKTENVPSEYFEFGGI